MPQTAYVTGGASGIGKALVGMLLEKGFDVFIADYNKVGAEEVVKALGAKYVSTPTVLGPRIYSGFVDTKSWSDQHAAFTTAIEMLGGRIDYVFPVAGIGERSWLPDDEEVGVGDDFVKPDLAVLDVDLKGVLWTVALAVQLFRRQERDGWGFRGKIGVVASICGLYSIPGLPIYTAAKHGLVGFIRSYGAQLSSSPTSGITLNAICPSVVRTSISSPAFYDALEAEGLLTPMQGVLDAFAHMLGGCGESGRVWECGPNGGFVERGQVGWLDGESERVGERIRERSMGEREGRGRGEGEGVYEAGR